MQRNKIHIGCAGWSIPQLAGDRFSEGESHLKRYASRFSCVEINSSFYRSHQISTYARWAASVPKSFKFSVKIPKEISHTRRLIDCEKILTPFITEARELQDKLGPLLLQLPPSLSFDLKIARDFFKLFRRQFEGEIVCEPRHITWFGKEANQLLTDYKMARVAADPDLVPLAALPGGNLDLIYYRLHGHPKIYYSSYSEEYLNALSKKLLKATASASSVWCIFDNTALGAATMNSLDLMKKMDGLPGNVSSSFFPI